MQHKPERDIEKVYTHAEFAAKLRRLADAVEGDKRFEIRIAGERIYVPAAAEFSVEHERADGQEEIEFQIRWSTATDAQTDADTDPDTDQKADADTDPAAA